MGTHTGCTGQDRPENDSFGCDEAVVATQEQAGVLPIRQLALHLDPQHHSRGRGPHGCEQNARFSKAKLTKLGAGPQVAASHSRASASQFYPMGASQHSSGSHQAKSIRASLSSRLRRHAGQQHWHWICTSLSEEAALLNFPSFRQLLKKMTDQYDRLRKRNAFLEQYKKEPMFENSFEEFDESRCASQNILISTQSNSFAQSGSSRSHQRIRSLRKAYLWVSPLFAKACECSSKRNPSTESTILRD